MKKRSIIFIVFIAVVLCFCSACSQAEINAKKAFEDTMNAFKSADKNEIDKYYSFSMVTAYIDKEDGEVYQDAVVSTLKKMDYKINSVKKLSDKAVSISVEITGVDFSKITENYLKKLTEIVQSDEYQTAVKKMSEDEYKKIISDIMIEAINNNGNDRKTKQIEAVMINTENGWMLGGNSDEFLGALFANLSNAVNSLS